MGRWLKTLWMLLLLAMLIGCNGDGDDGYELTLLHTNDVHSHIDTFSEDDIDYGGVAKRATKINELRNEADHLLVLDAGDQFQGTLFYTIYKGEMDAYFMNMLGYDAMTLGNHEFDDGPVVTADFIRNIQFPVVSANIDTTAEPLLNGLISPYLIRSIDGRNVAITGYITPDTVFLSSPGVNLRFNDIIPSLNAVVADLTQKGVNIVIALSHAGFDIDTMVASAVSGIDVIVGGHSHTVLSNTRPEAEGPYPVVVTSPAGEPVLVVQDGEWAKHLGFLEVTFDDAGVVESYSGEPIELGPAVAPDPVVAAEVEAKKAELEIFTSQIVGASAVDLDGERENVRSRETNLGNLIADAIAWNTGAQVVLQNGGGIRASIPAGDITLAQVLEVLPFGNLISTFQLTGASLLAALENGVSNSGPEDTGSTGRFLQVSGIRYTFDAALPSGSRIVEVRVKNTAGIYEPLQADIVYSMAGNDYMRNGGDEYTVLKEEAIDPYDFGSPLDAVVADYIRIHSPVEPAVEGRINRLN